MKHAHDLGKEGASVEQTLRLGDGARVGDEHTELGLLAIDHQPMNLAPRDALQRALEDAAHQVIGASVQRVRIQSKEQRATPALDAQAPEPEDRELPPEELDHGLERRVSQSVSTAPITAATKVHRDSPHRPDADRAAEETSAPLSREHRGESRGRNQNVRLAVYELDLTPAQVERHGSSRIERSHSSTFFARNGDRVLDCFSLRTSGSKARPFCWLRPPVSSMPTATTLRTLTFAVFICAPLSCGDVGSAPLQPSASGSISSASPFEEETLEEPVAPAGLPRTTLPERSLAALRFRPASTVTPRCDTGGVFCVHGALSDDLAVDLLNTANDVLDTYRSLGMPRPEYDGALGGDGRIDLYVDANAPTASAFVDPGSASTGPDRGTAFVVTPPPSAGCHGRQSLARAIAQTLLLGEDAALEPNSRTMLGGYLAVLAAPCFLAELEAIDTAQRAPERTFTGELGGDDDASFLFPKFLEERYGTQEPGKLSMALAAISSQQTPAGSPLIDEPDIFDALRVTQQRNGASLAETLLEFAVARAFVGSRSDETHMVDVAQYGDLGRVRIEWEIAYDSLPRTLKPLRPIEPLGATYLYIDLAGTSDKSELTFVIDWERPVGFRWAVVKLDASGAELSRKEYAPILGSQHVEATLRDLNGASALLIVGVNEGESRRDQPFDPGRIREPARSYLITLAQ